MKLLLILLLTINFSVSALPLKKSDGIQKELCYESYPVISWYNKDQYNWSHKEAYYHPYAYYWYHLILTDIKKDSEGYLVFQFMGHGRDRNGDEGALTGRGFKTHHHWHFEFSSIIVQSVGISVSNKPSPPSNYPSYEVNVVWDMFNGYQKGTGYIINDVANSQTLEVPPDHSSNDFSYITVNSISCNKHL